MWLRSAATTDGRCSDHASTFEVWGAVLGRLTDAAQSVQWWIGDALNFGERRYGEVYTQAIDATGLGYDALRQMKWVAGQYELSTRVDNLSWSHHREVAVSECPNCP